jgi:hypothetical protein
MLVALLTESLQAVGGPLFDKLNGNHLIAGATLFTIIGMTFIPLTTHIYVLAILITSTGVMMGFLDTGGT